MMNKKNLYNQVKINIQSKKFYFNGVRVVSKAKSKSKKADPLADALAWEKKAVDKYSKMEAAAMKKEDRTRMKIFSDLRKDSEKHIRKIESTMEKIKREEAKRREKARRERERLKAAKAAKR